MIQEMCVTSPRRVVHLTSVHAADDTRIYHKECRTLADAGYEVVLIAQAPIIEATAPGIRVIALPRPRSRWARVTGTVWQVLRAAWRERADVYHLHDPELLPAGLILKVGGAKVVYDAHEDWPGTVDTRAWIPPVLRPVARRAVMGLEFAAVRLLDGTVVGIGKVAARFPAEKVALVQNFPLATVPGETTPPRADDPPLLVYVGDITEIRGAYTMVQAMGELPPEVAARLVIAGSFSPPSLEAALRALPGGERLETRGWLSRDAVQELLAQATAGLVLFHPSPSHNTSQPNKLFEYMSAGLPVIASDFVGMREILGPTDAGMLVDPLDPAAIAAAIVRLLRDPVAAAAMGCNGRTAVADRFGWASQGDVLLALYRRLLPSTSEGTRAA
jgi:glycosyltransferase involved in cell wall biosynthesis